MNGAQTATINLYCHSRFLLELLRRSIHRRFVNFVTMGTMKCVFDFDLNLYGGNPTIYTKDRITELLFNSNFLSIIFIKECISVSCLYTISSILENVFVILSSEHLGMRL